MKYQDKSFSVGGYSDRGRDEFDRIFGREGDSGSRSPAAVRIAIVGSRNFPDEVMVRTILHGVLKMWHLVVSGGAPGVDTWAEQVAQTIGLPVCVHRA
jgi:hypothetical protein